MEPRRCVRCDALVDENGNTVLGRIHHAVRHMIEGLRSDYPICCILHFCIDSLRGLEPARTRRLALVDKDYVPCALHIRLFKFNTQLLLEGSGPFFETGKYSMLVVQIPRWFTEPSPITTMEAAV